MNKIYIILFNLILLFQTVNAEASEIFFVGKTKNPVAIKLVQKTEDYLPGRKIFHLQTATFLSEDDIIITIGKEPLERVLETKPNNKIISAMIRSASFEALTKGKSLHSITSIFIDINPAFQFLLAQEILGSKSKLKLAHNELSSFALTQLIGLKSGQINSLEMVKIESFLGLLRIVDTVGFGVIILDEPIYSRKNVPILLKKAFSQKKAILGFNSSIVRAGGVGSAFVTIDNIAKDLAVKIKAIEEGRVINPSFTKDFEISINQTVARSLDLTIQKKETYKEEILRRWTSK